MPRSSILFAAWLAALSGTAPAQAQPTAWGTNGYLAFNGVYQGSSTTFFDTSTLSINQEDAVVSVSHEVDPGPVFEMAGGGRVYKNLGFGFAASYFRRSSAALVSASVPHPFFFEQPRTLSGETAGLSHQELAIHLDAMFLIPVSERFQISVFGGPSFYRLKQGLVTGLQYSEEYPYDEAQFAGADETLVDSSWSGNQIGYNLGADVTVYFTRTLGIGVTLRRSEGQVELTRPDSSTLTVDVGGTQVGAGIRVRF